jgi:hypothetical protein
MVEWEVWLADGSRMDSRHHAWTDVPDGILVVRWWDDRDKGINWGDGYYGEPSTRKAGTTVEDELFQQILNEAQAVSIPPSQR